MDGDIISLNLAQTSAWTQERADLDLEGKGRFDLKKKMLR